MFATLGQSNCTNNRRVMYLPRAETVHRSPVSKLPAYVPSRLNLIAMPTELGSEFNAAGLVDGAWKRPANVVITRGSSLVYERHKDLLWGWRANCWDSCKR